MTEHAIDPLRTLVRTWHDSEVFGAAAIRFPAFHPAAPPSVALRHFRGIEVK